MSSEKITLKEVDEICITILMDNTVDLLMADRNIAQRFHVGKDRVTTIAEHGFFCIGQGEMWRQTGNSFA
ncbi:MAG: hypothetical protein RQM95_01790 [Syntrophaceticus schinkii]